MQSNFPFFSATSNALLKLSGLLRWKVRLAKDVRLSLPLKSDEDRQAYISASRRASSVIVKAEAWQTTCSSLSPKSNLKSVHSLLRSIAGSSSSSPNFPNCSSLRKTASVYAAYLRSHFPISQPKATSLSSAVPRALCNLTRPFALLSLSLNLLRLPPIFPPPPPLAQTKLPIPC